MIVSIITCNLCRKVFTPPSHLIVNTATSNSHNARVETFLTELTGHFLHTHSREAKALAGHVNQFGGMLILQNFNFGTDADLIKQRDMLRWGVHQATLSSVVTDDSIEAAAEMFAARVYEFATSKDYPDSERVNIIKGLLGEIMLDLRNILQEPDKYETEAILNAPEAQIFTPAKS